MRLYDKGSWGFCLIWGIQASVFPRALALAAPNAVLAFILSHLLNVSGDDKDFADNAFSLWAGFSSVLFFVLYFRSNVAYNRWWEGGTLLQQTRGEWFNAYSSLVAFTSSDTSRELDVEAYLHMLARLMSLLFSAALQQVSPNKSQKFEIIESGGLDPGSLEFLTKSTDKVEVILQWIQRSTIVNMQSGVLVAPPPVMSRAFQEISRGIVNLQNARKIADFPFPFPYAQTSIVMLCIHWAMCPTLAAYLLNPILAACTCFTVVFFLWCINFIALDLESPFGTEDNDLPMEQMQCDWNKSVATLLVRQVKEPPRFAFDAQVHRKLEVCMSDGSTPARRVTTYVSSATAKAELKELKEMMAMDSEFSTIEPKERLKDTSESEDSEDEAGDAGKDTKLEAKIPEEKLLQAQQVEISVSQVAAGDAKKVVAEAPSADSAGETKDQSLSASEALAAALKASIDNTKKVAESQTEDAGQEERSANDERATSSAKPSRRRQYDGALTSPAAGGGGVVIADCPTCDVGCFAQSQQRPIRARSSSSGPPRARSGGAPKSGEPPENE